MVMLYPGCSLTSAPAAPRARWSPGPGTAHAHAAAHHPQSWEHLCAGPQGHKRQARAVFKASRTISTQRSTKGMLRSRAVAGLGGLAPTTLGMNPTPVSATLTLCSPWRDSCDQHTPFEGGQHGHTHSDL